MGAIIELVMVIGLMGFGAWALINRCTLLPDICQSASGQSSSSSSSSGVTPASANDNNKQCSKGCCTCIQKTPTDITCKTTGGNTLQLTSGSLSLADQCDNCASNNCVGAQVKVGTKQKCGCCSCSQINSTTIRCTLSDGTKRSLDFTSGTPLADQCDSCHKLCQSSKAAKPVSAKQQKIANTPINTSVPAGVQTLNPTKKNIKTICSSAMCKSMPGSCNGLYGCNLPVSGLAYEVPSYYVRRSYFADTSNYRAFRNRISFG